MAKTSLGQPCGPSIMPVSLQHELFQLVLDALKRVVNALDMSPQHLGDLLIAFSVKIRGQHAPLQRRERLVDAAFNAHVVFLPDEQFLRVGAVSFGDDIQQRAVAFLFVDRLVEGNIGIQGNVFLAAWRF